MSLGQVALYDEPSFKQTFSIILNMLSKTQICGSNCLALNAASSIKIYKSWIPILFYLYSH